MALRRTELRSYVIEYTLAYEENYGGGGNFDDAAKSSGTGLGCPSELSCLTLKRFIFQTSHSTSFCFGTRLATERLQAILQKNSSNLKLFCNEVYCTNASLFLIKIMLCSKFRCQRLLDRFVFHYKICRDIWLLCSCGHLDRYLVMPKALLGAWWRAYANSSLEGNSSYLSPTTSYL